MQDKISGSMPVIPVPAELVEQLGEEFDGVLSSEDLSVSMLSDTVCAFQPSLPKWPSCHSTVANPTSAPSARPTHRYQPAATNPAPDAAPASMIRQTTALAG